MTTGDFKTIKALTFDVFGTLTDWRSTIIREGGELRRELGVEVDWAKFADAWRAGYQPAMERVRTGELPWRNIDSLHRGILDELLETFNIPLHEEHQRDDLNRVWHRLDLWPDVREGMERLRRRFIVAPLSNGNVSLLTNMAKRADLRWDCVLSAELSRHYKPDPEAYLSAAEQLGLKPREVMMVAAHNNDLKGARSVGFATAFVCRPREYGPGQTMDLLAEPFVDLSVSDLHELADQMGC